jgi:uncharacterized delta-60 repeat protein
LAAGASGLGQGPYGDFKLMRLLPDGTPDPTFGTGGIVTTDSGGGNDNPNAMVVQPDGKILIGGLSDAAGTGPDWAMVRFNPDGSLDTSFGVSGLISTSHSSFVGDGETIEGLVLQPDGKIVAAGHYRDELGARRIAVGRYTSSGALDSTFGTGGFVRTSFGLQDAAIGVARQADGKIVVVRTDESSRSL